MRNYSSAAGPNGSSPADLFADVAPKVLAGWRFRAAVESPSHLRTRARTMPDATITLLAALLAAPDGTVREVVFPAVRGGEQTMI